MERTIETEMNDRVALQLGRLILLGHQKDAALIAKDIEIAQLRAALNVRPVPKADDAAASPASPDHEQESHPHAPA